MEARSEALEAHRGDFPVAVAAGAADEVDLLGQALEERRAQFREQGPILARCGGQRRVETCGFMRHPVRVVDDGLRRGLSRTALWYLMPHGRQEESGRDRPRSR